MLDDAVLNHKPQTLFMSLLIFYLVFIIGDTVKSIVSSIPTAIWMMSYDGFFEMIRDFTANVMAGSKDTSYYDSFISQMIADIPSWLTGVTLISSVALAIAAVFYCKRFEKRPLSSMGIRKKDFFKEYGLGALIGALMIGFTFFIIYLTGAVSIKINPTGANALIALFFIGFVIQGASEEIIFRGYFMMTVARDNRIGTSIAISSVLFSLLHSGGNQIDTITLANILMFGIFIGVYVFKRGDVFGAMAIHTFWNFVQGCVLGSNVSGMGNIPSIFVIEAKEGMEAASGGAFGLEASYATTAVLLIALSLVFLLKTKKGEESLSDAVYFE